MTNLTSVWKCSCREYDDDKLEGRICNNCDRTIYRVEIDVKTIIKEFDEINKPKHYNSGKMQPLDFIDANLDNLGFYEATIIQYIFRWKLKNGLKDLEKAQFYLNRLIEIQKNEVK